GGLGRDARAAPEPWVVDREDRQGVRRRLADRAPVCDGRDRAALPTKGPAGGAVAGAGGPRRPPAWRPSRAHGHEPVPSRRPPPPLPRRVRVLRPVDRQADPEVRFETDPGVQVQADWADCGRWLVGDQLCTLQALVAVLGFSRMGAVGFGTEP